MNVEQIKQLEKELCCAMDNLRANFKRAAVEYIDPVLAYFAGKLTRRYCDKDTKLLRELICVFNNNSVNGLPAPQNREYVREVQRLAAHSYPL